MKTQLLLPLILLIHFFSHSQKQFEGMWISDTSTYVVNIIASEYSILNVLNISFIEDNIIEEKIIRQNDRKFTTELVNEDNGYSVTINYKLVNGTLVCDFNGDYNSKVRFYKVDSPLEFTNKLDKAKSAIENIDWSPYYESVYGQGHFFLYGDEVDEIYRDGLNESFRAYSLATDAINFDDNQKEALLTRSRLISDIASYGEHLLKFAVADLDRAIESYGYSTKEDFFHANLYLEKCKILFEYNSYKVPGYYFGNTYEEGAQVYKKIVDFDIVYDGLVNSYTLSRLLTKAIRLMPEDEYDYIKNILELRHIQYARSYKFKEAIADVDKLIGLLDKETYLDENKLKNYILFKIDYQLKYYNDIEDNSLKGELINCMIDYIEKYKQFNICTFIPEACELLNLLK